MPVCCTACCNREHCRRQPYPDPEVEAVVGSQVRVPAPALTQNYTSFRHNSSLNSTIHFGAPLLPHLRRTSQLENSACCEARSSIDHQAVSGMHRFLLELQPQPSLLEQVTFCAWACNRNTRRPGWGSESRVRTLSILGSFLSTGCMG